MLEVAQRVQQSKRTRCLPYVAALLRAAKIPTPIATIWRVVKQVPWLIGLGLAL